MMDIPLFHFLKNPLTQLSVQLSLSINGVTPLFDLNATDTFAIMTAVKSSMTIKGSKGVEEFGCKS